MSLKRSYIDISKKDFQDKKEVKINIPNGEFEDDSVAVPHCSQI
jgi:hypothetical protein